MPLHHTITVECADPAALAHVAHLLAHLPATLYQVQGVAGVYVAITEEVDATGGACTHDSPLPGPWSAAPDFPPLDLPGLPSCQLPGRHHPGCGCGG